MVRMALVALALLPAGVSTGANACSFVPPPLEQVASSVAANGVLIRGTVIQAFDASKQQPEIIRADEIYVGDGKPRDFVIYHSKSDYDPRVFQPYRGAPLKVGHAFDRLVLVPARSPDGAANGRWSFDMWGGNVVSGQGLQMLVDEAVRVGRFQAHPPKDQATR